MEIRWYHRYAVSRVIQLQQDIKLIRSNPNNYKDVKVRLIIEMQILLITYICRYYYIVHII